MIRQFIVGSFALFLGIVSSPAAAEPLRWKFEGGQELPYRLVQEMEMTLKAGPAGGTATETSQTMEMVWIVESVDDDGSARMKHDIRRVRMSMTAPQGQGYEFDTASEEPPEGLATLMAPVFEAMVEEDYKVTMSPRGEITDFEAPPALIEAVKNMPGGDRSGTTDQTIQLMALQTATLLPPKELAKGESWSTSGQASSQTTLPMFGAMMIETTYRYDGPREIDGRALEVFSPTLKLTTTTLEEESTLSASLKSNASSGEILFDRSAGRLETSTIEQVMDLQMKSGQSTIAGEVKQTATVTFGAP